MMVLRVEEECVRLQSTCVKEIEHKDLHQRQDCDEECTEDSVYEASRAEQEEKRTAARYLLEEECQRVCVYLRVCVVQNIPSL